MDLPEKGVVQRFWHQERNLLSSRSRLRSDGICAFKGSSFNASSVASIQRSAKDFGLGFLPTTHSSSMVYMANCESGTINAVADGKP